MQVTATPSIPFKVKLPFRERTIARASSTVVFGGCCFLAAYCPATDASASRSCRCTFALSSAGNRLVGDVLDFHRRGQVFQKVLGMHRPFHRQAAIFLFVRETGQGSRSPSPAQQRHQFHVTQSVRTRRAPHRRREAPRSRRLASARPGNATWTGIVTEKAFILFIVGSVTISSRVPGGAGMAPFCAACAHVSGAPQLKKQMTAKALANFKSADIFTKFPSSLQRISG